VTREDDFQRLQRRVVQCRSCPRLVEWRERVAREKVRRFMHESYWGRPVPAFGSADANLLIVGLAPAAHGGNRTGRMFTGDRSGDWMYEALHRFGFASQPHSVNREDGLALRNCTITASVRCAPPDNKPLPVEMETCRAYLRAELGLLASVRVVVTLGQIAFRSFLKAWVETGREKPQPAPKFWHGAECLLSGGLVLISSYHPSQQNTQTGKLTRDMFQRIFERARGIIDMGNQACLRPR
jgi:uracil-DNA glycosylase